MIKFDTAEREEWSLGKDFRDVDWTHEAEGVKVRSPLLYFATPDHACGATDWKELNDQLAGVIASLSVLETYEMLAKFTQPIPKLSRRQKPLTLLRPVSEEDVSDHKQRWNDYVADLTDESLVCHSPSSSSESDLPLPTTPKATPPPFEHFHLNSAATPFVPRDPRHGSPTEFIYPSLNSPSARDDIGFFSPLPAKRQTSSKTRALVDDLKLSPSPVEKRGLASSSSSSDLGSLSNEETPSFVADDEGWIVMDADHVVKSGTKKPNKSRNKARKQQVQIIAFPTLLPPPAKNKEKERSKDKSDEGWIEWPAEANTKLASSKSQKGRHNKSRSSATSTPNRSHNRQASLPISQPSALPSPQPIPQNNYYYAPHVFPATTYMVSSPYQSFQAMVPMPVAVPMTSPNHWVLYPTMA